MAEQQSITKNETKNKQNLRYQRDKDREKVKGIFRYYEAPGGTLKFCFRKHKGDPIEKFELVDGSICEIPLGVAKHLNKNGWYPVHAYRLDDGGKAHMHIGKKVQRFGFNSLEFADIDDFDANDDSGVIEEVVLMK